MTIEILPKNGCGVKVKVPVENQGNFEFFLEIGYIKFESMASSFYEGVPNNDVT